MNFFSSVFSDEPDSPPPESDLPDPLPSDSAWSFGGLIQTLASKSESVLENYRRDFEEFGSGLRKETAVIREAASRAVKDLPASLDAGASVAQESLESVGQAIDDIGSTVWNSTAQIISHGRESLLISDLDYDSSNYDTYNNNSSYNYNVGKSGSGSGDLKRYSRFDTLVRALQSDVNTYVEEPEDLGNFNEWKLGFELEQKGEEIRDLIEENGVVEDIYEKVVPNRIDHESFWSRYFYRLHKLKQAEDARAKLVKRAIAGDDEEDLSWDFDDDNDNENNGNEPIGNTSRVSKEEENSADFGADGGVVGSVQAGKKDLEIANDGKGVENVQGGKGVAAPESKTGVDERSENVASNVTEDVSGGRDKLDVKCEEKEASEVKTDNDNNGSCKDSDISVVSSQPSMPGEEDIGWDEIEDIESNDESKGDAVGSTSRIDLRKKLSVADQDEDLSWDIEDDDVAVKS
ncbi:hypothetical protein Fmac_009152 [Flemingia macrophylla]|uniref:BSD domain-containing protein n=1 Tax=Flemingia macrophylla TaxID=520843 RepID=A0ABD1MZF3_9FABA